jgi:hypothetical protein
LVSSPITIVSNCIHLLSSNRVDNIGAITLGSKPRFELIDPAPYPDPVDSQFHYLIGLRYKTKLSNLTSLEDLSKQTIEAYHLLRILVAEKDKADWAPNSPGPGMVKAEFELRTSHLMHRLVHIVQYKIPEASNQNVQIYGLFGNAALAQVTTFVCETTRLGSMVQLCAERIRATLEVINIPAFQIAYPEMMLWIILVGGLASIRTDNQGFFITLLAEACLAAGINKVTEELPIFLADFLWSVSYLNPAAKDFWDEVAVAMAKAGEAGSLTGG